MKEILKDLKDLAELLGKAIVTIAVILTIPFIVAGTFSIFWEYNTCNTLQKLNKETNYQWVLFGGCMEQDTDGYWKHHEERK